MTDVDIKEDLRLITEQERRLTLDEFDLAGAWKLGTRLREIAIERGRGLTIEIRLAKETVFPPQARLLNASTFAEAGWQASPGRTAW